MHVFFVYLAFIGVLSHAQDSSEDKIDLSYMSNVLCNNHPECASCLSKMSITCEDKYKLDNVRSVFEDCYSRYRKKMNPLTKLCDFDKMFGKTVTFESILKQFPHFNQNCHQNNQLRFRELLQENMADHMRKESSTFLCLVTLTEGILSTTPWSVPPQDLMYCEGFLPISERSLESDENSSESSDESLGSNKAPQVLRVGEVGPIYFHNVPPGGNIGSGNTFIIGSGEKYGAIVKNQKPKRGSKKPKPVSDGSQPGYGGPQSGYGGPQSGYGGPQSGYGGPQSGYGVPQSGYAVPQSGYGGSQPSFPVVQPSYPSYPSISGEKGCSSKLFMASVFAYQDGFFYKRRSV